MAQALPLRIFLASPSDVVDERAAVRACVAEHAARQGHTRDITYDVVEWDQVRGTALSRPQEAINQLIAECHFMIVLFKRAWGSAPGSPWGYTSGTEEELFTGLLELGEPDQPMRDVWVAFIDDPEPNERVQALRSQFIARYAVMFESVRDLADLKTKLTARLVSWEALVGTKHPRQVDLVPSSAKEVLKAARLRIRGEKLIDLGEAEAGRRMLAESAVLGGPVEQLAYARVLRRSGDLELAKGMTQKAIDFFTEQGDGELYSTLAADAFSAQARVLGAQGHHQDAVGRLEHALELIRDDTSAARTIRCRIHDDLGLSYQKLGDLRQARVNLQTSLELREADGDAPAVCQSLINLARLEVADSDLEAAAQYAERIADGLRGSAPVGLHANAEALMAQVRLRQGRPIDALPHARRALAINRQMSNRNGEAISLLLMAQCSRAAGQDADAAAHARECFELNQAIGNEAGMAKAQWILGNLST